MRIEKAKIRYPSKQEQEHVVDKTPARSSAFTSRHKGEFYNIHISKLSPFHKQARKFFDEDSLTQMAETIKVHGIRQPLTIIPIDNEPGYYEVVSGERRLKAAKIAGLELVPCIIIHDPKAAIEIALIENVQREDLHPIELARAYQQLLDEKVCNNKMEIAGKVGVNKSSVTETMKLLDLPSVVQTRILEERITSRSFFRELLDKKTEKKMLDFIESHSSVQELKKTKQVEKAKTILKIIQIGDRISIGNSSLNKLSYSDKKKVKNEILQLIQQVFEN